MPSKRSRKPFFDRQKELAELDAVARKPGAKLVVIKGRRRVGKSRLTREFGRRHPEMSFYCFTGLPPSEASAAAELQRTADLVSKQFKMPRLKPEGWDELLWQLAERLSGGNAILVLDEINWLARSDPMFSTRLWALWEETLSHLDNFVLILSGSLGGWIDAAFSSNTGYLGRISRNMTIDELPVRDALGFFGARGSRISLHEKLQMLLVTGGIPRYLEEIDPSLSAKENIHEMCFTRGGLLFLEYEQLMDDLFLKSDRLSRSIIEKLADKPLTLAELGKRMGRQRSGKLSEHVENLEKAGFLMRNHTWDPRKAKPSPSPRYKIRVIDNYVRFYLKAIQPYVDQVRSGLSVLPPNLHGLLGLQFENLVLKNRQLLLPAMGVDLAELVREGPYFQQKGTKHASCQVDYLVQTRYALYVVEIKFMLNPVPSGIIEQVQRKIRALNKPGNRPIRPILVHVNGVADSVVEKDYFDKIIDFGELLTK